MSKSLSYILVAAALTGCTLAPKHERPAAPVPASWPASPTTNGVAGNSGPAATPGWREFFRDARQQKLIELALANNRDLRVATLNVELARTQYRVQRAALLPTIEATASGSRQRVPGDLNGTGAASTSSQYSVGGGVTAFELDLFGRVRSLKNQALEEYLATDEARKSAHLTLVAEVVIQSLNERELDEQLTVARQTLETVRSAYDLNRRNFDNGAASELDLRSAEAQVQTAKASVASLTRLSDQARNALALLIGQSIPDNLPPARSLEETGIPSDPPAGLPSEVLQHRPDILRAEHELKAVNANLGAARAAFFPKILLTGSGGTASAQLSDLFTGPQSAWNFGPQITLPIFDTGKNFANLKGARVRKQMYVAQYEKAIQSAFRDVADALVARRALNDEIEAGRLLVKAEEQRYKLADLRYRNGVDNYLTVLTAQQSLYSARQNLIQSQYTRLANSISLYKALGGGWLEHTPANSGK
jgi:outer membrane protein, multidrug efflux system